jgi:hypothetical protein
MDQGEVAVAEVHTRWHADLDPHLGQERAQASDRARGERGACSG